MGTKRCLACADDFDPCPRVAAQNYCSRPECQRERRRLWQKDKRANDSDYRGNQLACQRRWRETHGDYWKRYREQHPDYEQRNRELQRERNEAIKAAPVAKMDAIAPAGSLRSGRYRLRACGSNGVAKMDEWIVQIVVLTRA
ncbi:MAG: hypothetical protein JSR38_18795 [Proteobacteria bacterium]|jgi:hypothetical protein|nr:hypothetical protein [Pseudomonadota bacterium]